MSLSVLFFFFCSKQDKIKSHDDIHQKNIYIKKKRHVLFDAKNTDGICASLLEASTNYRQTIIARTAKVD
jgi:hypothetical protein